MTCHSSVSDPDLGVCLVLRGRAGLPRGLRVGEDSVFRLNFKICLDFEKKNYEFPKKSIAIGRKDAPRNTAAYALKKEIVMYQNCTTTWAGPDWPRPPKGSH